jgi:4-amino-4-deoxy-L-arabinose transferase-like glycosyltransferase
VRAVRLAQAAIDTSTALAVYLLARRWLPGGGALFAGALVALNPFLIYFTALVLTETIFTAMLAWGMLLLAGRAEASSSSGDGATWRSTMRWLGGGMILALAVLVRQSGIGLPVVMGIGAAFVNRERGGPYHRRWPLPVGATMLLLTLLVLLPWAYRNFRVLGEWVWTTTNGGITLYDGFNPDATGASDQTFVVLMPELRAMTETARSQHLSDLAKDYVRRQPLRAVELAVIKVGRTWSPVPLSVEYGSWKHRAVGLLYAVPLDVLVVIGLFRSPRRGGALPWAAKVFLLLPAIYFTAVHMLSVGSLRYRIPAEPPMAVIAASAAVLPGVGGWKRASRGVEVSSESGG